jgi:hypothetical protein
MSDLIERLRHISKWVYDTDIENAVYEATAEIEELRAQLARCVQALETYRKSFEDGFASSILDSLPEQAKADAEVLRCAEEVEKIGDEFYEAYKKMADAVRAAKEARDE